MLDNKDEQLIINNAEEKMGAAIENLGRTYNTLRAGRANPHILDRLFVDYYGVRTPVQQIAQITAPEATTIVIQPYESNMIKTIERAILTSDIGINPANDGKVIRLSVPPLTEERRQELVKQAKKSLEECKVEIRNVRRKAMSELKAQEKNSEITEDDLKDGEKELQKVTDNQIKEAQKVFDDKQKEILEV